MTSRPLSPGSAILYGKQRFLSPAFRAQTGPFSFVFENGMLKHLRIGSVEIAHRIYFAVRDEKWATLQNEISEVRLSEDNDVFDAAWCGRCRAGEIDYKWCGRIRILASGLIEFKVEGNALKTFKTPRIGLCLLLSTASTLGKAFEVTSAEGQTEQLRFETIFKRTQLACRWRALRFSPAPTVHTEYTIDGSCFDLEDQRNFGDVSYKAMAGMPFENHEAVAGTKSEQVLTIHVSSKPDWVDAERMNQKRTVELVAEPSVTDGVVPQIGLSLGDIRADSLPALRSVISSTDTFLHGWLDCSSPAFGDLASHYATVALKADRPVYLTLENLNSDNLSRAAALLSHMREQGVRFLQIDIPESAHPGLMLLRTCLRDARLEVLCGKRVASFKERASLLEAANSGADFLAWCGTPLSHQDDDETLLENAAVFSHQALTAKSFAPNARLTVGPIHLSHDGRNPDPRCRGLIAAAFVACCVQSLAHGRVDRALLWPVIDLVDHATASSGTNLRLNRETSIEVFPSYYAIRQLSSFAGNPTFTVRSSDPLRVLAFGVTSRKGRIIIIVNQTSVTQEVRLIGIYQDADPIWLCALNESTYSELLRTFPVASKLPDERHGSLAAPFVLAPFSVNFLTERAS